ncbi:hypothetical protein MCUN1_002117 [Malassezia cuniculi]|uniref:protein-tyrosine-phosphatase n=1 Tax=Malassezia cuniculi TaxID=948313 RepID=A0AAF0JBG4_9BASI|nr:hypothetical protein MCUN1_002117 [Malassezia cuniculi]
MDAQIAPDESDLIDTAALVPAATASVPSAKGTGELLVPLVPVSHRLWFGVFSGNAPDVADLNRGNGKAHAAFPSELIGSTPQRLHWFCVDDDLVYLSFSKDWGPLNVAMFYRFCVHVHQMLLDNSMRDMHLILYTTTNPHHKANAALLCALYAMTIDHITPADAFYPFSELEFMPFRDAGYGRADFCLSIQDVLYGVRRAIDGQLLDLATFDLEEYEHYEQVQNGDWNWITRDFLAFASPKEREYVAALAANTKPQSRMVSALLRHTVKYFKDKNIALVVRLNNPLYDRSVFVDAGIEHADMYFDDGSNPSDDILLDFIHRADEVIKKGGRVAVHCKAGLGRTGVLIGAYLIWKHGFSAREAIGYIRLMRPGCVVGPQQHFMYENAAKWIRWGEEERLRAYYEKMLAEARALPPRQTLPQTPSTRVNGMRQKPTPCVGQPRKGQSPDIKRRRLGETSVEAEAVTVASPRKASGSSEVFDEHVIEQLTQCTDEQVLGVLPAKADEAADAKSPAAATHKTSESTTQVTTPAAAKSAQTTQATQATQAAPASQATQATPATRSRAARPTPYTRPETPGIRTRRAMTPSQDRVGQSVRTPKVAVRAPGGENVAPVRKTTTATATSPTTLSPTRPATRTVPGHTAARTALRAAERRRRRSSCGDADVPA